MLVIEGNICPTFLLRDRVAGNGGQVNWEYAKCKSIIIEFVISLSYYLFVNNKGVTASEVSVMLF
jgi:hypothetical protein